MRVVEDSPGHSAVARVPPLPDDAMDALINAMGTPEDHDRRMAAWRDAERDAMARVLGRGRGGDEETVSNAADDAVNGEYRRRSQANAAVSDTSSSDDDVSARDDARRFGD